MPAAVKPVRVGVVCDLREEGWHSMDFTADMLLETLPGVADGRVQALRLGPEMIARWTRVPLLGGVARAHLADRLTTRLWDYPHWLARRAANFDLFHIVDHSYAHLTTAVPPGRAIVTCNDTDAFEAARPDRTSMLGPAGWLASHLLRGLSRASHVTCISEATRRELLAIGGVPEARTSVVHLAPHPACSPETAPADAEVGRRFGLAPDQVNIIHVGSTIPRKRIDLLLEVFAGVRRRVPAARLIRVGGSMTPAHQMRARDLGILESIVEVPFVSRAELAALYRAAALCVLPSDREGFGLPVLESMACGTPVVASAIPSLREIGGDAAVLCPPGDATHWISTLVELLQAHERDSTFKAARRDALLKNVRRFSWTACATQMATVYERLGGRAA